MADLAVTINSLVLVKTLSQLTTYMLEDKSNQSIYKADRLNFEVVLQRS